MLFLELNSELRNPPSNTPPIPATILTPLFEAHPLQLQGFIEAVWETFRKLGAGLLVSPPSVLANGAPRPVVPALGTINLAGSPSSTPVIAGSIDALLNARDPLLVLPN